MYMPSNAACWPLLCQSHALTASASSPRDIDRDGSVGDGVRFRASRSRRFGIGTLTIPGSVVLGDEYVAVDSGGEVLAEFDRVAVNGEMVDAGQDDRSSISDRRVEHSA